MAFSHLVMSSVVSAASSVVPQAGRMNVLDKHDE
jgi:hypothetical protein